MHGTRGGVTMVAQAELELAPVAEWESAEREARRAAALVAAFVGVPSVIAVGATLVLFAMVWLVLLAPAIAAALTWTAWRYARSERAAVTPPGRRRGPRRGVPDAAAPRTGRAGASRS